jgi:hypothetical protein
MKRSSRACINKESIKKFNKHCRCEKCVEEKRNFERDIPNDRLKSVLSDEIPLFLSLNSDPGFVSPPSSRVRTPDVFSDFPPFEQENEQEIEELANFLNDVNFDDPGDGNRLPGTGKHPDIRCHCVGCRKCALGPDRRCNRNKVHRTNERNETEFRDQCKQCSRIPRWNKILARNMTPHPNVTIKRRKRRRRLNPQHPVIRSFDSIRDYMMNQAL